MASEGSRYIGRLGRYSSETTGQSKPASRERINRLSSSISTRDQKACSQFGHGGDPGGKAESQGGRAGRWSYGPRDCENGFIAYSCFTSDATEAQSHFFATHSSQTLCSRWWDRFTSKVAEFARTRFPYTSLLNPAEYTRRIRINY